MSAEALLVTGRFQKDTRTEGRSACLPLEGRLSARANEPVNATFTPRRPVSHAYVAGTLLPVNGAFVPPLSLNASRLQGRTTNAPAYSGSLFVVPASAGSCHPARATGLTPLLAEKTICPVSRSDPEARVP